MVPSSPVELLTPGTPPSGEHDINGIPIKHRNINGAEVRPLLDRSRLFPPPLNPGFRRSSLKRGGPLQGEPGIEVTRWADDPIHETEILE